MLWMKAWLETRWRMGFALCMGAFLCGVPFVALAGGSAGDPHRMVRVLLVTLGNSAALWALTAGIMLAGSGVRTSLGRPGACESSGEESTLFTLSLPVTRIRLFAVRNVLGILEIMALLALFAGGLWFLLPPLAVSADDGLGYLAAIGSWSLAAYAISACLSTFGNEGRKFRGSVLVLTVLFVLSVNGQLLNHARLSFLPRTIDIYRQLVAPLITHQIPWVAMILAWILTVLASAAAIAIIQRRDY